MSDARPPWVLGGGFFAGGVFKGAAQDEISSQLVEVESRELSQIEDALNRLRDGRYGECEQCDKPIPLARLQAVPYAISCIECARKQEKYSPRFSSGLGDSSQASNASL